MARVVGIAWVRVVRGLGPLRRRRGAFCTGAAPGWRAAALLAAALVLHGAAAQAKQTIAQQPTAWTYGLCDEFPPFPQRGALACTISGGGDTSVHAHDRGLVDGCLYDPGTCRA